MGVRVVLKSEGRIWLPKRTMRGGARVYIPGEIVLDSQFPFREDGRIEVQIDPQAGVLRLKPLKPGQG